MEKDVATSIQTSQTGPLTDKTVRVAPVKRGGGWLPAGHDGEFMFTGTFVEFDLPISRKTGRLVSILTKEEQEFFEKELDMNPGDLSIYKKKDNFWHTFKVKLDKEITSLNLNDPIDNLTYRVCKVSGVVAPDWKSRYLKGSYKFAFQDEEVLTQEKVTKANRRKEAYRFLGKVEGNKDKMYDVLRVYGDKPAKNTKAATMYARLDELIEDDVTLPALLAVIEDPNFELKIFIEDAIRVGALSKKGTNYHLPGGDKVGGTIQEAIDYFSDEINQDTFLKIKNQIENGK